MKTEFVIIYDSITNSVFESQIIAPLIQKLDTGIVSAVHIVSFERSSLIKSLIIKSYHPQITITLLIKPPFFGSIALWIATRRLKKIVSKIHFDSVIARGPLAGWIAFNAIKHGPICIQARGLCAEEYRYVNNTGMYHRLKAWLYEKIEKKVYGLYARAQHVTVESVSHALRAYCIDQWNTPPDKIAVSTHDIPAAVSIAQKKIWRKEIRARLGLKDQIVYVYAGSAHIWQCPQETIQFFCNEYAQNKNAFLLILTAEQEAFKKIIESAGIPHTNYLILTISHNAIYQYLAAADIGLLFRKNHIINWVSRPTKALEYQAVGLPIKHNNTVEMLTS